MGLFRPFRRRFWYWWDNRRLCNALDLVRAEPGLGKGIVISVRSDGFFIELPDGRKYFWHPRVMNSLLGIAVNGTFEPQETELLSGIIRPSDVVFDIGANFGWYTVLFFRLVGGEGSVHAFEPVPPTFLELQDNLRLNGSPANVSLNSTALGERDGAVKMHIPGHVYLGPAFASAHPHHEGPQITYDCGMETLDGYVARKGIGQVDIIKCDVEGAELQVLRGGRKLLSSPRPPMLFIEVVEKWAAPFGYTPADLFSFLGGFGYEFYYLEKGKLRVYEGSGKLPEYNFLCVPPGCYRDRVGSYLD